MKKEGFSLPKIKKMKVQFFIKNAVLFLAVTLSACQQKDNKEELKDWAIGPFVRPKNINPLIIPSQTTFYCPVTEDTIPWENGDTFNPAATIKNDTISILYRAEDQSGQGIGKRTSRIGLARSINGVNIIKKAKSPVLYPNKDAQQELEWPGGCEDPRVAVTEDGTYIMLYTQWNRKLARLAVAHSKDLIHWEKFGPAFQKAYNGKFANIFSKSASIVTSLKNDRLVITKVNGKYLMYWGERHVYTATSTDLINWEPLVDNNLELIPLASPRNGYFDSELTECGPPAVLTNNGIVLIYNGKNKAGKDGDSTFTANAYCAGQFLFDKNNPTRVLDRLDKPFLVPSEDFEKSGQYPSGTVFAEGLVYKDGKWFLYYGCADSRVAVAVSSPEIETR